MNWEIRNQAQVIYMLQGNDHNSDWDFPKRQRTIYSLVMTNSLLLNMACV